MMQVWFLFKVLEGIIGTICVIYHCLGFQGREPLPHILIFCGTFFGFTIMSFIGAIALSVGAAPPALTEFILNFVASVLYIISSIVSMHFAETDFHLMYLSDFEEPKHPFFAFCRAQSICALTAGSLHLLHAVLAFDVMITPKTTTDSSDSSGSEDESDMTTLERRPIRLYFLSKLIETKLRRFKWFDNLCSRRSPNASMFSMFHRKQGSSKIHTSQYSSGGDDLGKITKSKSFFTKSSKSIKLHDEFPKSAMKNEDKRPTPTEETPDSQEESLSNITYSDYTPSFYKLKPSTLSSKDEKPKKDSSSSITSATGTLPETKATARVHLPDDAESITSRHSQRSYKSDEQKEKFKKNAKDDPLATPQKSVSNLSTPSTKMSDDGAETSALPEEKLQTPRESSKTSTATPSLNSNQPRSILKRSSVTSDVLLPTTSSKYSLLPAETPSQSIDTKQSEKAPIQPKVSSLMLELPAEPSMSTPKLPIQSSKHSTLPSEALAQTSPIALPRSSAQTGSPKQTAPASRSSLTKELPNVPSAQTSRTLLPRPPTLKAESPKQLSSSSRSSLPRESSNVPKSSTLQAESPKQASSASRSSLTKEPQTSSSKLPTQSSKKTLPRSSISSVKQSTQYLEKLGSSSSPQVPAQSSKTAISRSSTKLVSPVKSKTELSSEAIEEKPTPHTESSKPALVSPVKSKAALTSGSTDEKPTTDTRRSITPVASTSPASSKPKDEKAQISKASIGTSIPSLPFSDASLSESFATGVNTIENKKLDQQYFTPAASTGSIFEDPKKENEDSEDEGATPKPSKEKVKKPPPSPKS